MGLSRISVPNFTTFDHGVLWAALDSHGRKIIKIGKCRITMDASTPNKSVLYSAFLGPNELPKKNKKEEIKIK